MIGSFDVDSVAHRSFADAVFNFAAIGDGNVVNLLMKLSVSVEPSFYDLNAIEICSDGIAEGVDHEGRCFLAA